MGASAALPMQNGMGTYMSPGLQEKYPNIQFSQFMGAEMMASKYGLNKEQLDAYGYNSHKKAIAATKGGKFKDEIVPLTIKAEDGAESQHLTDEGIRFDVSLEGIKGVKLLPRRRRDHRGDLVADLRRRERRARRQREGPQSARRQAAGPHPSHDGDRRRSGDHAGSPPARHQARARKGRHDDRRHRPFEVNEAFASVPVAWLQQTGADPERLNVHGGAIALGHPLGASGTKLMTTLLYALKDRGKKWGLQTMCEGGGLANVTIVERL